MKLTNRNLTRTTSKNQELRKGAGLMKEEAGGLGEQDRKAKASSIFNENDSAHNARLFLVCLPSLQ